MMRTLTSASAGFAVIPHFQPPLFFKYTQLGKQTIIPFFVRGCN
jgi:hypothetical protein